MIKLRDLDTRLLSWINPMDSMWSKGSLQVGGGRRIEEIRRCYAAGFQDGGRGSKPRNTCISETWKRRTDSLLKLPEETQTCWYPDFSQEVKPVSETSFGLLTSQIVLICYSSNRKRTQPQILIWVFIWFNILYIDNFPFDFFFDPWVIYKYII